jgi:hypothetical protein
MWNIPGVCSPTFECWKEAPDHDGTDEPVAPQPFEVWGLMGIAQAGYHTGFCALPASADEAARRD